MWNLVFFFYYRLTTCENNHLDSDPNYLKETGKNQLECIGKLSSTLISDSL